MALAGLQTFSAPLRRLAVASVSIPSPTQFVARTFRSSAQRLTQQTTEAAAAAGDGRAITLPFEQYRQWVGKLKLRGRIAGLPFALGFGFGSSFTWVRQNPYIFTPDQDPNFDPQNPQAMLFMGMVDPMIAMIASNLVAMGVGFVVGGSVFRGAWRVFNRDLANQIKLRTTDYQKRLDKHRVLDIQKMGEDFYGEKIANLADYRQWVKMQRAKLRPADLANYRLIKKKN